jgi:plastocyanin
MNHKIFPTLSLLFLLLTIITSSIDSSFFFLFYKNTDNNNYYSYHYHLAYAADGAKSFTVMIPKGSANPEVDITKLGPRQWYLPRQITVHTNDTITWKNNDTESHTVTSGVGAGIESLMSNKRGTPNGIFDSSTFKPGQSWTHTFTNPGTYTYFCTIHPWMEGVVSVQGEQAQNIPKYPVDATGKRILKLPV